jgi:hypothetical protein
MKIGPKHPSEIKTLIFDFSADLGDYGLTDAVVTVELLRGTDPQASTLLEGDSQAAQALVTQTLARGVLGCSYAVHCLATDGSGQKHYASAELDVARI